MSMHCMIDLETLDTRPSAVVLSIGAVLFDPNSDFLGPTYYAKLEIADQVERGRTKSAATMEWWAKQSDAAREEAFGMKDKQPTEIVLSSLRQFINHAVVNSGLVGVWGNGAAFDNVIVNDLYASFGAARPWPYWMDCCFRTVKSLWTPDGFVKPERQGTHHNALDDATHQARYLQALVKAGAIARF